MIRPAPLGNGYWCSCPYCDWENTVVRHELDAEDLDKEHEFWCQKKPRGVEAMEE